MPNPTRLDLWNLRLYYFMWIGGAGFLFPFINLFYNKQGLSGTEIGLLSTFGAIAALIAAPVWSRWNDSVTRPRRLVQFGLFASALCMVLLSRQVLFAWMAIIIVAEALLSAGVSPASDALALSVTHGREGSGFGSVRLWGSLGWAVTAFAGGSLIEHTGLFAMFGGYAICTFVCVIIVGLIRTGSAHPSTASPTRFTRSASTQEVLKDSVKSKAAGVGSTMRVLLRDRVLIGLAIALSVVWFTSSGYHQFEVVYLDQLGAGETLIGLASTIGAVIELPGMLWADQLARRLGAGRLLRISFALDVVRWIGVLIAPSVTMILISRAMGGIAYSFYAVALVEFIGERAPDRQVTTALALFTVTLPSLIRTIAAPVGGAAFDAVGAYWLYAMAAGGTVAGWMVLKVSTPPASPVSYPRDDHFDAHLR